MTRARKHLVCPDDTPYYHVTSRCVRRAFLCGHDKLTGKDYEHRRDWIETRVRLLSSLFSIELCAYAVMSNHYHLVIKLNPDRLTQWSDDEILERWTTLYRGPLLVQRYRARDGLSEAERHTLSDIVAVYRSRLASLSWFMKCLNEPIARKANAEDQCTGHFWEARFHSQALMSDEAFIRAMVYVDLNPIRAKMASTPESSDYTSIKARLCPDTANQAVIEGIEKLRDDGAPKPLAVSIRALMPFSDCVHITTSSSTTVTSDFQGRTALPMVEREYFLLVDETARMVQRGKRGRMNPDVLPIVERLGLHDADEWIDTMIHFRQRYRNDKRWIGNTA